MAAVLFGAVDTGTWSLIVPMTTLIAILWLVDGWASRGLLLNPSPMLLPLVGLCTIGLVQLIFGLSLDPYSTRLFVIRLICYAVFFAAALTFINTPARLAKVAYGVIIFGAAMAFFGILQKIGNADAIYGMREAKQANPFGPFVNSHHFAAFMEMSGAVALSLLFGKAVSREKKFLIGICLMFSAVAIVLTGSRGGLVSFVAMAALVGAMSYLVRKKRGGEQPKMKRLPWAIGGVAGLFLFVGFVSLIGGDESLLRAVGMTGGGDDISNGRLHFWSVAMKIFQENPIIGAGLEAFGVAFTRHDTWTGAFRVEHAHNDYIQTLADSGLLGLACAAAFLVLLFRKGLQVINAERDDFRLRVALGALAGCFAIAIHSFFDFPLRTPSNAFFFLLLAALATVAIPSEKRKAS